MFFVYHFVTLFWANKGNYFVCFYASFVFLWTYSTFLYFGQWQTAAKNNLHVKIIPKIVIIALLEVFLKLLVRRDPVCDLFSLTSEESYPR